MDAMDFRGAGREKKRKRVLVSSILKALKKVEEASQPSQDASPWPPPVDARSTIAGNIQQRWMRRRRATYILAAACLVILIVLLYFRHDERLAPLFKDSARVGGEVADTDPATPIFRSKIETSPATAESQGLPASPGASTPPAVQPPVQAVPKEKQPDPPQPTPSRPPVKSRPKVASASPQPQQKAPSAEAATAPAKSEAPGRTASPETPPTYSRLQRADLELQAIAWSPEPSKRIAVINGRIVKEGETVGEYTLMRIRPDDIVLNDGSKSWQVIFGLRR